MVTGDLPGLFSHFRHLIGLPTLQELEIVGYITTSYEGFQNESDEPVRTLRLASAIQ